MMLLMTGAQRVRRVLHACAVVAFALSACACATAQEVHGSSDHFASRGIVVAWAIQRGADEATTVGVFGFTVALESYAAVSLVSVDPFSGARLGAIAARTRAGRLEARIARQRFADFPRTELHFYRSAGDRDASTPALVVYYLGVPDTTPEFTDPGELDRYLAQRLAAPAR